MMYLCCRKFEFKSTQRFLLKGERLRLVATGEELFIAYKAIKENLRVIALLFI